MFGHDKFTFDLTNVYRIKFEQPSSESENSSGSESDIESPSLEFYNDPLLAKMDHGYPVHALIQKFAGKQCTGKSCS